MTIFEMRRYIANKYYSNTWKSKVAMMNDNQVLSIYTKMKLDDDNAVYIIKDRDRYLYGRS
jgi:hypothetical protein